MDASLLNIVNQAAGQYFIVQDASEVPAVSAESKLRLFFINTEKGGTNSLYTFSKGNKTGFQAVFGTGKRSTEVKGNFSISECLKALEAGPIAVINLRKYTSADVAGICGLNPNIKAEDEKTVEYSTLFNTNSLWSPRPANMISTLAQPTLLNFGNVGTNNLSIFVVKALDVTNKTSEGEETLASTALAIDEYPALNPSMLVKDTFVDVYVFKNKFDEAGINTNQYYGQYFDVNGNVDIANLANLAEIAEAGFLTKYTGSLIPGLKSETAIDISIDKVINNTYMVNGLICNINDDLFEADNIYLLDMFGSEFHDAAGAKVDPSSDYLLSHVVPAALTTGTVTYPMTLEADNVAPVNKNVLTYGCTFVDNLSFIGSFEQGLRVGDSIKGASGDVKIVSSEILDPAAIIGVTTATYTKVKYTCSGPVGYIITGVSPNQVYKVKKLSYFVNSGVAKPFDIASYVPRAAQFTNGTAQVQSDILDMMNEPGITKGLKSIKGLRYIVDCFKSFVEPSYKYQYGILMNELDESNRFVRALINEPFINDLERSTNPLFKANPSATLDLITYLPQGGNTMYSSILLTKFVVGESLCFFFGPGNLVGSVTRPTAAMVSNLFYSKKLPFDIVANTTGYVDGVVEIEYPFDDKERAALEKFRYNPIIDIDGAYTIYGNLTGQKKVTKQQQIHNSELLAYIKEMLYAKSKGEPFKKGTYDEYLQTETEIDDFMKSLAFASAIKADYLVKCNAENNTTEIADYKIKLVEVEYTPFNSLEKIVFKLKIN